ncbi:MAG: hypothetical protein C4320_08875 [Armatimonadota bacterium]
MKALLAALALFGVGVAVQTATPDEGKRPIKYFADHCARCHGPGGSRYEELSARTDAQLKESIRTMAEGPGGAPLSEEGLRLQLSLHRAIRAKEPFIAILSVKDGKAEGEASPDAKVVTLVNNRATTVPTEDGAFTLTLKDPKTMVSARVGGKVATIPARRVGTSHGR